MARLPKKEKKPMTRKSKAMVEMQKTMEVGTEPKFDGDPESKEYRSFLMTYFNWANLMFEPVDLKEHFIQYCKANDMNHSLVTHINPSYFNLLGKVSYLINTNTPISKQINNTFCKGIFDLLDVMITIESENKNTTSYDEDHNDARTKAVIKYTKIYNEIDRLYKDTDPKTKILKVLTDNKPPMNILQMIHEHYLEDYQHYSNIFQQKRLPKAYKESLLPYESFTKTVTEISQTQMIVAKNVKSSIRKPRKKKIIPHSKIVEKIAYLKQDDSIGMVSINPESIIGASALLIYNTKTRKFGMFVADQNGLSVKGTTIINFDESQSFIKTLRKPNEQLPTLITGTKKKIVKTFESIRSVKTTLKGRINGDSLLLKTFK